MILFRKAVSHSPPLRYAHDTQTGAGCRIVVPVAERPHWADEVAHLEDGTPHDPEDPLLQISRSHAGGLTLHAHQRTGLIGVDIVALDDLRTEDMEALVSLSHPDATPEEIGVRSLRDLGTWWAATEAAVKAWGGGLPELMGRFQISLSGTPGAAIRWKEDALPPLQFYPIALQQDLIGVLATDRTCADVSMIAYESYPTCVSGLTRFFT